MRKIHISFFYLKYYLLWTTISQSVGLQHGEGKKKKTKNKNIKQAAEDSSSGPHSLLSASLQWVLCSNWHFRGVTSKQLCFPIYGGEVIEETWWHCLARAGYFQRTRGTGVQVFERPKEKKETKQNKKQPPVQAILYYKTQTGFYVGGPMQTLPKTTFKFQNVPMVSLFTLNLLPHFQITRMLQLGRRAMWTIEQPLCISLYQTLTRQDGFKDWWLGLRNCYVWWGRADS